MHVKRHDGSVHEPCVSYPAAGLVIKTHGGRRPGAGRKPAPQPEPPPAPVFTPRWAVFATHPQAERLAVSELARSGYTAYLPLIAIHRRDPVVRSMVHIVRVPLFAGYVFVWLDTSWGAARRSAGVREILMGMNGMPYAVPESLVEALRAQDAQRCELAGESLPALSQGVVVTVSAGPLEGHVGVVKSGDAERVQIELMLFGRFVPTWLDRAVVDVAP